MVTFHVMTDEARQCSDLMWGMFELDIVIGSAEKAELLKLSKPVLVPLHFLC